MLAKFTALYDNRPDWLPWLDTNLSLVPAKRSKHFGVDLTQFVMLIRALSLGQWALTVMQFWRPALPPPVTRRRK